MEIKENSLDALCLFSLYICAQDDNLSKDETTRIFSNIPSLAQYYFELFGEFSSLHLHQVSIALNEFLTPVKIGLLLRRQLSLRLLILII